MMGSCYTYEDYLELKALLAPHLPCADITLRQDEWGKWGMDIRQVSVFSDGEREAISRITKEFKESHP